MTKTLHLKNETYLAQKINPSDAEDFRRTAKIESSFLPIYIVNPDGSGYIRSKATPPPIQTITTNQQSLAVAMITTNVFLVPQISSRNLYV